MNTPKNHSPSVRKPQPRRIAILALLGLIPLYGLFVATGYAWINYGLNNRRVTFLQVALFRWKEVRRDMAAQQYAEALAAWKAKDYSAAYTAFSSALRNDSENVELRCTSARFLREAGAAKAAIALLEEGLDHAANDPRLITALLGNLTDSGLNERALELIHGRLATQASGPSRKVLQTYEVLATLSLSGPETARALLERFGSSLRDFPDTAPVAARVLWAARERFAAIEKLDAYLQQGRGSLADYSLLAEWQRAGGLTENARDTVQRACSRFPDRAEARLLLLDTVPFGTPEWGRALKSYTIDFGASPAALLSLAEQAGRRGWTGLAYALYSVGTSRFSNLGPFALCYADALIVNARFSEAQLVLTQTELQLPDNNERLFERLRDRQVLTAAALGNPNATRDFARRLAILLRGNEEALEEKRRYFARLKIREAVEELDKTSGKDVAASQTKAR